MIVSICIGSSCHTKGAQQVVEQLMQLTAHLGEDVVELGGCFCLDNCTKGVCVKLDDELFSLSPDRVLEFYQREMLPRIGTR